MTERTVAGPLRRSAPYVEEWYDHHTIRVEAKLYTLGTQPPYFSITGEIVNNRKRGDNAIEACGCLHESILRTWPDLAPLVAIHLSNADGVPMYAVEDARFWMGLTVDGGATNRRTRERRRTLTQYGIDPERVEEMLLAEHDSLVSLMDPVGTYHREEEAPIEVDADGIRWVPTYVANLWRITIDEARELRDQVKADGNDTAAIEFIVKSMKPRWAAEAAAAIEMIRGGSE